MSIVKRLRVAPLSVLLIVAALLFSGGVASAAGSSASCTPSSGAIAAGSSVSCAFTPGSSASFMFWSAPGFTPQSSNNPTATFTAARAGSGTITAYWLVPGSGAVTQTFTYSINAPGTSTSCNPGAGSIPTRSTVSCSIQVGAGGSFLFWIAPGFTPLFVNTPSATFTAAQPGPAQIVAVWIVPGQGAVTQTFTYTITG